MEEESTKDGEKGKLNEKRSFKHTFLQQQAIRENMKSGEYIATLASDC